MRILVDTNILLRWSDAESPEHDICLRAVDHLFERQEGVYSCAQVLIEYWAVSTRPPAVNGLGFSIVEAAKRLSRFDETLQCLPEPADIAQRWRKIVMDYGVSGKQAHDARLVALMLSHGITQLLTLNTPDFARYPEITPLTPAEALAL